MHSNPTQKKGYDISHTHTHTYMHWHSLKNPKNWKRRNLSLSLSPCNVTPEPLSALLQHANRRAPLPASALQSPSSGHQKAALPAFITRVMGHPYHNCGPKMTTPLLTAITLTNVVFPEYWRPTRVSSISSFQKRLLNQSNILLINASISGEKLCGPDSKTTSDRLWLNSSTQTPIDGGNLGIRREDRTPRE